MLGDLRIAHQLGVCAALHRGARIHRECPSRLVAVVTGVIFIRFSKPKAKIVYAKQPVVANHNGVPTLMIRIANGRTHMLTDASVRLSALSHIPSYPPETIAFGTRYADAVSWDDQGRTSADIRRVSMIEPDLAASRSTSGGNEEPPA
jgi:hypothetical protein